MKQCFLLVFWKKVFNHLIIPGVLFLLFFAGKQVYAEDILSGFDETSSSIQSLPHPENETGIFKYLSGYSKVAATYNFSHEAPQQGQTDWQGLSRLCTELLLEYQNKIKGWKFFAAGKVFYDFAYNINGRKDYTHEVLDKYEKELELREVFIQGEIFDSLDMKLGRQITVWGRSDNFRVTDVLNPLNNREPGLTDIEDLRLPLVMSKFDYFLGSWNLDLIALHEHRFDKNPQFGHDFYPSAEPQPHEEKPAATLENTEFAAELKGTFTGWDISLYWAKLYNDLANSVPGTPMVQEHRKLTMYGSAISIAKGNFLYITEAAHFRGLHFMNDYKTSYNRTDFLAGIEYNGFPETVISFDYLNRYQHGYSKAIAESPEMPRQNDSQFALRITSDHLHNTLHLTALLLSYGEKAQHGAIERFSARYDFIDDWSITAGVVLYQSGNGSLQHIGDNDRFFMELRYDF